MNTTILIQLGHKAMHTITLRHPETSHPNLHMGIHALMQEHTGRKFAFKADRSQDWQHGTRNSLYDYIAANVGKTVYVRLYTDVTKYARA
jgi:hypothetical protein